MGDRFSYGGGQAFQSVKGSTHIEVTGPYLCRRNRPCTDSDSSQEGSPMSATHSKRERDKQTEQARAKALTLISEIELQRAQKMASPRRSGNSVSGRSSMTWTHQSCQRLRRSHPGALHADAIALSRNQSLRSSYWRALIFCGPRGCGN